MADSRLPLERTIQITRTAHTLWDDFLEFLPNYSGEHLVSPRHFSPSDRVGLRLPLSAPPSAPEGLPRNKCATEFFNYCSQILLGVPALVVNYRLDQGVPNLSGRATS